MNKAFWVVVGLIVVLALGVLLPRPSNSIVERVVKELGAFPGGDLYSTTFNLFSDSPLTEINKGTTTAATFTDNAITLTEGDLLKGVINVPLTTAATITLPATSTLSSFVKNQGARARVFVNNFGTAVITVAGTGVNGYQFRNASSTLTIPAGVTGELIFQRGPTTTRNVFLLFEKYGQ